MPNQAELIEKAIAELYVRERAYMEACNEAALADAEYRRKRALKYLNADGTIADRNAQADLDCYEEHKRKIAADATQALTKALLDDCRAVISARQSILSAQAKAAYAMDMHATTQT